MIKLTKLKAAENANFPTAASVEEYRESLQTGELLSPSVDYWIIGEPISELKVGDVFWVTRFSRNGVVKPGIFNTSPVKKITDEGFETENSVYLVGAVD